MAVIALSIEPGTSDRTFATTLAACLGLEAIDLRAFEREIAVRSDFGRGGLAPIVTPVASLTSPWGVPAQSLAAQLEEELLDLAAHGQTLIVSWGAPAALRTLPHVATVRLRAPKASRMLAIQRRLAFPDLDSARMELESEDALIARFVHRAFGADWRDPDLFDLTVDVERTGAPVAAELLDLLVTGARYRESAVTRAAVDARLAALHAEPELAPPQPAADACPAHEPSGRAEG